MAQAYGKVRIFVASPGDVSDERARLARIVESMNRTGSMAERFGLTLELLRWETHVSPDVGRPQQIVFDQLDPEDWDIFVGILWMRFGTQTGRLDPESGEDYRSGTEEEFNEALHRRKAKGTGWPKIMFYRCVRPVDPRTIDLSQYGRVQDFFRQFEPDGKHPGLVSNYTEVNEFERLVRNHLENCILEYIEKRRTPVSPPVANTAQQRGVDEVPPQPDESWTIKRPGMFRYFLDRYLPSVHTWLTTTFGLFELPLEWRVLQNYLRELSSTIADDIRAKTYIEPHARDLPEDVDRLRPKRTGFLTPIQQLIKEIIGVSHGGDAQNARISALSKKSRFVRNIVKRLLHAKEPLVLLGDPGTGKSITLQQAAMLIAEKESKRIFPNVCLFIRLGEFQVSGEVDNQTVWDYVKKSAPQEIRPFLDDLKDLGRLVIFFDGMDEMSRERYNEHTTALSVFAGSRKGITKTLFSCRITDFTPRFQHNRLVLLPFSRNHIFKYLKRQISQFPITIGTKRWSARKLADKLAEREQPIQVDSPSVPMQTDNPFVLWLLCNYLQEKEDWPESRVHLLEHYNRSNYERKTRDALRKGKSMPDIDRAFLTWGRIAYEITDRNKGAAIPLQDVEHFLTPEELPAVQAGIQCGVLQKSLDLETTLVRFEHHRFQEYFTAFYLKNNKEARSALRWLDKLDAPRWQETLINLVLMDSGQEALSALGEAIEQGLARLNELMDAKKTLEAAQVETLLADRVELASRVIQQVQQQSNETLAKLFATFQAAVYWLADYGNPITQVKMMWASKIVPGIGIYRVAREALSSDVSWVRQQALIITASVPSKDVNEGALQQDVLHSFASGRFLNRFGGYIQIARTLKQKRLWCVLVIGFVLCLFQLLAVYGMVATARKLVVPSFSAVEAFLDRYDYLQINKTVDDAARKKRHEARVTAHARYETVASATRQSLDSWWFLVAISGIVLMALLYTLRHAPGQHFLIFQSVGYICLLLPFIWWPLWLGYWLVIFLGALCLVLFIGPIVSVISWALTLLINVFTLILFAASALHWTGPVRKKRLLLEAMWENCGFRGWGKAIAAAAGPLLAISSYIFLIFFIALYGQTIKEFIIATFGLFPFIPTAVNVALSIVIYAEIIGFVVSLVAILKWKYNRLERSLSVFAPWTWVCMAFAIVILLIWGLSSVNWQAILGFIVAIFGLLPFFPPLVNVALSVAIHAEIIGCVVILVSGFKKKNKGRGRSLNVFVPWTGKCLAFAIVVLLIWGLSLANWQAIWQFIASNFGLFSFFPAAVNVVLSVATYAEIIGCLASLVLGLRRGHKGRRKGLKLFVRWSQICLGLVMAAFLGWGLYAFSYRIAQTLAIILFSILVILLSIFTGRLMRDMFPSLVFLRRPIGYAGFNSEGWKRELRELDSDSQATILSRTTHEMIGLSVNDYLVLLQEVEKHVRKEPALSAYWAKRYQLEQIIRQERIG